MRRFTTRIATGLAAIGLIALWGCVMSPVGTNTSQTLYPQPEGNQVTLEYKPPAGKSPSKVLFLLDQGEEGAASPVQDLDDETKEEGQPFVGTLDVSGLSPGLHFVAVFLDDDEEHTSRIAFVVPDPERAAAAEAEGAAEEGAAEEGAAEEAGGEESAE